MPRCNLTLKQKCQIIELSSELSTDQIAKKFHVHPTTVTRTLQKKKRIIDQASRVNVNFKTVQTNQRGEEHDAMILEYIRARQDANEPLTIKEICDKAVECAKALDRTIKSKRGWWRRFKIRCNIIRSKLQQQQKSSNPLAEPLSQKDKNGGKVKSKRNKPSSSDKKPAIRTRSKSYTFRVRDSQTTPTITTTTSTTPVDCNSGRTTSTTITTTMTTTTTITLPTGKDEKPSEALNAAGI